MSQETFERAQRKALELAEKGWYHGIAVVSLHLITNGWDYSSARCAEASTHAVEFRRVSDDTVGMVIWPEWNEPHRALYIMDDGATVRPLYVSGWQAETVVEEIYLGEFPLNVKPDGSPRLRSDNAQPVDHSTWLLSARKAYHVKVNRVIPVLAGQPY